MIDNLIVKSYAYLMQETLDRIKLGKQFDVNFKPYKEDYIKKMIKYYEDIEKYEECKILHDFIKLRFDHDTNYKKA